MSASLNGLRVLMLCDDLQIDRRIIHEGESLARQGCEVIVLGRSGEGHTEAATDGLVKIERVDYTSTFGTRRSQEAMRRALASPPSDTAIAMTLTEAEREFSARFIGPDFGPRSLERWIATQGWLLRNTMKALLWPPYRLNGLRRYFPNMHWSVQYAIYLPTLALTPRPLALRWHWRNVRNKAAAHIPLFNQWVRKRLRVDEIKQARALRDQITQFDDLNLWEMALFERGCFLRPDVVQAHDLPQLRAAYYIGQKLGIPVIYDAHELYPSIATLAREQQVRLRAIEAHFMPKVARSITVNPFFAEKMAKDYAIPAPEVILNAIDLPPGFVRGEKKDLLRRAMGLGPEAKIVLYQGWVTLARSLDQMVAGMKHTPSHIHLAILGYGDDIPALKKLARESGVAARVHFLEPVPQRAILDWVASADAGIIPYQAVDANARMCSPNKLFEFIAAGLPIIASDLLYLRSVVAPNGFGVLHKLAAPRDYGAAIRAMFDADENRFRENLLAHAGPYLWPAQEATLLRIYREVLGSWQKPATAPMHEELALPDMELVPAQAKGALRIFHGTYNTAGIPGIMARAERALGLDSKAVCHPSRHFGFQPDITLEHTVNSGELLARIRRMAEQFDVFVFHFGHSLANETLADVPLLKRMGKTVIFYFHGCDIRQSKETIRKYEFSACKDCWPQRCSANRDLALEMATRYADAAWVSTPDLLEFVPGATLMLQPVDLELYKLRPPPAPHDAPYRVIHAPSDPQLKGTRYLTEAVTKLQAEGEPLSLELLQDLPQKVLRERLLTADFAVDQLLFGSYGMLGAELMAAGVPVICFLREDVLARYPETPPMLNANPQTIGSVLRDMLARRAEWPQMAEAGRAYVERHHDARRIAAECAALYAKLHAKPLAGAA